MEVGRDTRPLERGRLHRSYKLCKADLLQNDCNDKVILRSIRPSAPGFTAEFQTFLFLVEHLSSTRLEVCLKRKQFHDLLYVEKGPGGENLLNPFASSTDTYHHSEIHDNIRVECLEKKLNDYQLTSAGSMVILPLVAEK